jgi:hypothetical protein
MAGRSPATFAGMSLRDRLKTSVKKVINKFSGEYSAAETEIRAPDPSESTAAPSGEVKVTRARLKRPPGGGE